MQNKTINVIGGGLAGCECAYQLAKHGFKVNLYEMKPIKFSPAHHNTNFAELVCSNSLKSNDLTNACGLLKQELRLLDSLIIKSADLNAVPSGNALSVDREKFSQYITNEIRNNKNIKIINKVVEDINLNDINVIATGPLTDDKLAENLIKLIGEKQLYFFDAVAPIVEKDSLDMSRCFVGNRYGENESGGDYINCTMSKEEYDVFYNELINAKTIDLKDFENKKVFEGCMAVEIMAKRGYKTLTFGPLKPVGLYDKVHNFKPYAVLQLRKETLNDDLYNMVGFQTNLTFAEQKRVFSLIPALKNANFVRYGVMHKNTYLNAPNCLNKYYQLKNNENIFIAGQLSGVEGYVESVASGMYVALNIISLIENGSHTEFSNKTCIGALPYYITNTSAKNFQPMNANWGIINTQDTKKDRQISIDNSINEIKYYLKEKENGTI